MTTRPVYVPQVDGSDFVLRVNVLFQWHPGFSIAQKQKSIRSLHAAATQNHIGPILEISSSSEDSLGRRLSAFNLTFTLSDGFQTSVESAYQGSKVFELGGPYREFYSLYGTKIKKDLRLHTSGKLLGFDLNGDVWPTQPVSVFYDWLYLNALSQNKDLADRILPFKGFTDIAFNPAKSLNCQARSAALFVSLKARGLLNEGLPAKTQFIQLFSHQYAVGDSAGRITVQDGLFPDLHLTEVPRKAKGRRTRRKGHSE